MPDEEQHIEPDRAPSPEASIHRELTIALLVGMATSEFRIFRNRFHFLDSVLLKSKQQPNNNFYCFDFIANNFGLCYILFIFFYTAFFVYVSSFVNYFFI